MTKATYLQFASPYRGCVLLVFQAMEPVTLFDNPVRDTALVVLPQLPVVLQQAEDAFRMA